jgi:hypothetical protein
MPIERSDIKIVDTRETTGTDASNGLVAVIRVTYTVRGKGPFVVDLLKSTFTGEGAISKVLADAEERHKLLAAFTEE